MSNKSEQAKCQENPLIQAIGHYGDIEKRLFRLAIADLRPKLRNDKYCDEYFIFHMTTKEMLDQFQGGDKGIHGLSVEISQACKNMMLTYVKVGTAENHKMPSVFDKISFSVEDGLFIQFHKDMREFILDLETEE